MLFRPNTPWLHEYSVHLPVVASNSPIAARGSIAFTTMRWLMQRQLHDMRGLGEGLGDLLGVAVVIIERDIARHVVEDQRRARLHRLARIDHRGQRLDVERHRFGGILGLRDGLRDHAGDRIADEAHLVAGERRPRRVADRRAVAVLERQVALEPAIAGKIGGGQHREHARHGLGGRGVDRRE